MAQHMTGGQDHIGLDEHTRADGPSLHLDDGDPPPGVAHGPGQLPRIDPSGRRPGDRLQVGYVQDLGERSLGVPTGDAPPVPVPVP
ncbi:hypothetical protein AQJ67_19495 [Streptomyces caeruleatus]|uniref:Uncharacterized protein n=1 Tax=Streptomyces caeruleatus TaxID=661399 RepID=A0A101U1I2_9ACTN|nr:hypothetical protein AQJ67_19495 [Streptomyces caeruleatus]